MHNTFSAGSARSFVDKIIAGTFAADWHAEHAKAEAKFADLVTDLERHASSDAGWANRALAELYANDRLPMADRTKAQEYSGKAAQLDSCDSGTPQYLLHNAEFYGGSE